MESGTGMKLVLLAGTLTFANEWIQPDSSGAHSINWRVPVATVLAAAAVAGVGAISPGGGVGLGLMALIVAATTPLNGKSPVQQLASVVNAPATANTKQKVT
jgi:hypothetical protein